MKNLTIISSLALIALGLVGYFLWEQIGATKQSPTSLIPAGVGALMLLGGLIAIKKHALGAHISVTFAALGALAGIGRLASSGFDISGPAGVMILIMTVICVIYTIMAVRSFIAARKG